MTHNEWLKEVTARLEKIIKETDKILKNEEAVEEPNNECGAV